MRFGRVEALERRSLLAAAAVAVGPEFRVNAHTLGDQNLPAVAMDAAGNFVIAWESAEQDGSSTGIVAQRFDVTGATVGPEILVNTYTTDAQTTPAVAMDDDGDFVVAWTSAGQDGSFAGAFAQRFNSEGIPQGPEFRVNQHTTQDQSRPRVAMDDDGDFVVAWESFGQDGAGNGIFARRYDATGTPLGDEFRVNTHTAGHQFYAAPAMDDDGDFVIAWTSDGQDGSAYGVYAQRFSASGDPQGAEFRANTHTPLDQAYPSVAIDADGDFVITWASYRQDGSHWGSYAQRYDATGTPQDGEFRANAFTTGAQFVPVTGMDDDGDFVIVWSGRNINGSSEVLARQYDATGTPKGDEFQVNTQIFAIQQFPAVAMDSDGDFVVAWASQYQDGDGDGIFAQRYAVPPTVTSSSFHFATAPHRLSFTFDRDVSASLGMDDLVVQNLTTMQTIPSGDFSLSYDTATNFATFAYTGVLPEGRYLATLLAAGVSSIQGAPLASDQVLEFLFLPGDANNDGTVNLSDFNILAANFGQSPRTFSQGDFNYDGQVNLSDFNILASRFGTGLPAAAAGRGGASPFSVNSMSVEERERFLAELLS